MPTTAATLRQMIAGGRTVCDVGHWLPYARRWARAAVKRGEVEAVQSGWPDGRPAYRAAA